MENSGRKNHGYNQNTEIKTFPVPYAFQEVKETSRILTNNPSKESIEEIIKQAINFHLQGNLKEASRSYQYCLNQGFADHRIFSNYGGILKALGKLKEAEIYLRKAIELKPDFAEAYSNLGNILKDLGNLEEAALLQRKAIELKPDFATAHYNLGNILNNLGKLEEAALSQHKAIELKPDYANAYSNLGIVLRSLNKLKEAELYTRKAIEINPNFLNFAWNLYCLSSSTEEAEERINQCLKIDKNDLKLKLNLSAIKLHQGDPYLFHDLLKSTDKNNPYIRSLKWVLTLPNLPKLFFHKWALFDHVINKSVKSRPFYEFGVWRGDSFQYLIKAFQKGYGFDTFDGLPENWNNLRKGTFSTNGLIPKINGGKFIAGKFQDTLPTFFSEPRPMASIINFDADLYSSTICALNYSKPIIDQHTILIFDEFIIYADWENHEYKALNEFCNINNLKYEVLAVSYTTFQTALRLTQI